MARLQIIILLFFSFTPLLACDLDHAIVAIYAVRTDTGEVLVDQNSDLSMMPASCLKIVTTAAALHLLGPEHRFETYLEHDGSIDSIKTLHGNIYIRGGGDPCLGSDRVVGALSWKKQIETWADAIQEKGIEKITGKVIGDGSIWEKALAVPSWTWEDLGNYFGAGASGLSFHENFYTLVFKPGREEGAPASILHTEPPTLSHTIHNEVTTGPEGSGDQAWIYGSEYSSKQFVRGTVPAGASEFAIKGAIPDPATYCAQLLAQELEKRGVTIEQAKYPTPSQRVRFHTTYSPTVAEIVYWTNTKSLNLYAEHLFKAMGKMEGVTQFLHSQNIDTSGLNIADGSGLSRKNLITPKQLTYLLVNMKSSDFFPLYFKSLTQNTPQIRAKSGNNTFVKGSVGYADNCAFVILINNCVDREAMRKRIDTFLCELP